MPSFNAHPLSKEMWQPKVNAFVMILDASSSMGEDYNGIEKFTLGRGILANFNQVMPDFPIKTELRSFGHRLDVSIDDTIALYGLRDYSRRGVADALTRIVPGGPSPMEASLKSAGYDLRNTDGKIAMLIVSDGKDMEKGPLDAAYNLRMQFGDRLCIYTVLVGNDRSGESLMKSLSETTGCGQTVVADNIESESEMAGFVANVLLKKTDSWIFRDVKFDSDKDTLLASSYPTLDRIVQILKDHPGLAVEIQGHTDSTASESHNLSLSQRRAQSVMKYLVSKGIAANRLTAKGYGKTKPIDTNETEAGKANNRRVELKPLK